MNNPVMTEIVQTHYIKEGRFDGIEVEILTGVCEALSEHCILYGFRPSKTSGVLGSFIFSALSDPDTPLGFQVWSAHSVHNGRRVARRYIFAFEGMSTSVEGPPNDYEYWAGIAFDVEKVVTKLLKSSGVLLEAVVD